MKEGGFKNTPESPESEIARRAEALLDKNAQERARVLIEAGVAYPEGEEGLYKHLREGCDPRLFQYKTLLTFKMLIVAEAIFKIPKDSPAYDVALDVMAPAPEENDLLLADRGGVMDEYLLRSEVSQVRALALLYDKHFKSKDLSKKMLQEYILKELSESILEAGLKPPAHLRFLLKPDTSDPEEDAALEDTINSGFDGAVDNWKKRYIAKGVDPKIAAARVETEAADLFSNLSAGFEEETREVKEELERLFNDPDFRDPRKLADLILGY